MSDECSPLCHLDIKTQGCTKAINLGLVRMNKKQLLLWSLYDFANSIVFINFLLYFSQWLVIDGGRSDFWYNAIFAITTLILLVTGPSLAALTDKYGGRKFFLN